jgi:hypothetical protein
MFYSTEIFSKFPIEEELLSWTTKMNMPGARRPWRKFAPPLER